MLYLQGKLASSSATSVERKKNKTQTVIYVSIKPFLKSKLADLI